jgi:hypothetical protein
MKQFVLHKDLLCKKVKYFDGMFNSIFKERVEKIATFPEAHPDTFAAFVDWIYSGSVIVLLVKDQKKFPVELSRLMSLLFFC